jgi:hypothetical protein
MAYLFKIGLYALMLTACASAPSPPSSSSPQFESFVSEQSDFDHPADTEQRFLAFARATHDDAAAAEFLTQAARAQGVQDRLQDAHATLTRSGAEASVNARLRARFALEQGRLLRRAGDKEAAAERFTHAYEMAVEGGHDALAADAAHMMALISPPQIAEGWVERALAVALASESEVARAWVGTISYNWAMVLSEGGDHSRAALYLARSLAERGRRPDVELARATELALAHELNLVGSSRQARAILSRLLREARASGSATDEIEAELRAIPADG